MNDLKNRQVQFRKHTKYASLPCLLQQLQWHCVIALTQTILVPFYLIACCFVGSGCLMLNVDQITKALF